MFERISSGFDMAIQKAVEQARDTNFFEASMTGRGVYPPINVFEKEGDLVLVAELPGMNYPVACYGVVHSGKPGGLIRNPDAHFTRSPRSLG